MENIYKATKLIGDAYASQIVGANKNVETWLVHKLQHTFNVAEEIMSIFFGEKEIYNQFSAQECRMVKISAILHDLGRFYQHKDGHYISDKDFDHGWEAVKLIKDIKGVNDPKILFAIAEHNHKDIDYNNPIYKAMNPEEQRKADIMAKLLRDADKIENINCFVYFGMERLGTLPNGVLSEGVKDDIKAQRTINYGNVKNTADSLAISLAWVNDIYYDATVRKLKGLDFINLGVEQIKERGASNEDIAFLKEYLQYHTV